MWELLHDVGAFARCGSSRRMWEFLQDMGALACCRSSCTLWDRNGYKETNGYKERQKGSIIKSIVIIKSSLFIVHLKSSHSKSGISRDEVSPPPRVVIEVSTFLIINQVHHGSEINTQEIGNQSQWSSLTTMCSHEL